jgi:hypothetical protein
VFAAVSVVDGLHQQNLTSEKISSSLAQLEQVVQEVEFENRDSVCDGKGARLRQKEGSWMRKELLRLQENARKRNVHVRIICNTITGEKVFVAPNETCYLDELGDARNALLACVSSKIKSLGASLHTTLEMVAFSRWCEAAEKVRAIHDFRQNVPDKLRECYDINEDLFFEACRPTAQDPSSQHAKRLQLSADLRLFDFRAETTPADDPVIHLVLVLHSLSKHLLPGLGIGSKSYMLLIDSEVFEVDVDATTYRPLELRLALDLGPDSFILTAEHTLGALVPYVTTQEYRELHGLAEGSELTYHLYAVVAAAEQVVEVNYGYEVEMGHDNRTRTYTRSVWGLDDETRWWWDLKLKKWGRRGGGRMGHEYGRWIGLLRRL